MATSGRLKSGLARSARRREELRRTLPRPVLDLAALVQRMEFVRGVAIVAAFALVISAVVIWSQEQVKVRDGQIMTHTRVKRLDYRVQDDVATELRREEAKKSSPRVYQVNTDYLKNLEASLLGLPAAVAGQENVDRITPDLVDQFSLASLGLAPLQQVAMNDESAGRWHQCVTVLVHEHLVKTPLLESLEFQEFATSAKRMVLLPDDSTVECDREDGVEIPKQPTLDFRAALRDRTMRAGFTAEMAPYVISKLEFDSRATIQFDAALTQSMAEEAAAKVETVIVKHQRGEVLYARGDVLLPQQYEAVREEQVRWQSAGPVMERWLPRAGLTGLIGLATLFVAVFAGLNYRRVARNPWRITGLCALTLAMLALAVVVTVQAPSFLYPATIGVALLGTAMVLVAYDQRLAIVFAGFLALVMTLALEQSIAFGLLIFAGCITVTATLREVRHRNSLIRAGTWTAAVLGTGVLLLGCLEMPHAEGAWRDLFVLAAGAVGTSYAVCFLVLGILPTVERTFDITTGMTLAELRDPKQPLLRQLQQRAPGTYNHSLQVANLAEAAAEAINANSLLVYVGALYHDIGKMNKPDYFAENQVRGSNKHDRLSPAMSLLVIIGHVKDGMELAREYGLPRDIQQFIESHHGTTLVEYFYHAARNRQEDGDDLPEVSETEFRYPGPKPQSREAAILMLADVVESTTRTLVEPNPARIETLVRTLSRKRLDDGQFDECDLTFKQLAIIEESMINRLCAIHHSRISYPTERPEEDEEPTEGPGTRPAAKSAAG